MKKQNKQTTHRFRLRIIFFSVLIFAIIVAIIKPLPLFPYHLDFKITKETCSEDLNSMNQNTICQATCLYGVSITLTELEENELNFSIFNFSLSESINKLIYTCEDTCLEKSPIIETCEQVEVDKLMFNCLEDENKGISCNEGGGIFHKEDLTIDWLSENAECIFTNEYDNKKVGHLKGCVSWRIGDYEIEVLK